MTTTILSPSMPPVIAKRFHGAAVRGAELTVQSPLFEGRFGRMFRRLPAATFSDAALGALAKAMVAQAETTPTPETDVDDEENPGIAAGFTYLGQFLDHDLTFDPASSLERMNDPDALVDYRTPRFDLDSVYGRGPDDQPYLYRADGLHLAQGRVLTGNGDPGSRDLPRSITGIGEPARALTGDPRNDENVIVSQLHGIFIRFHNRMVEVMTHGGTRPRLADVQREVRWHYQWMILHHFLPTIVGKSVVEDILPHLKNPHSSILSAKPDLRFYSWKNDPFMPVEFSVAAYRFGHSMVRPVYRLNQTLPGRFSIFGTDASNALTGFREFPAEWAIDWSLYFDLGAASQPENGPARLQRSYKIDSSLVNPLGSLPPSVAIDPSSLAKRNLMRGVKMGLPSGQSVARQMHMHVIPDAKLKVGKANEDGAKTNPTLMSLSSEFRDNAPLWYYILAEAQQAFVNNATPILLGPVGARIVAEVFIGLLLGDKHSFLSQSPSWRPRADFMTKGAFGMGDLINQAKKA